VSDLGGESACWAHFLDEIDTDDRSDALPGIDLGRTAASGHGGSGAIWSLPHGGDLDANLVHLTAGALIDDHVNDEVDVLIVGWDGTAVLHLDDGSSTIRRGVVTLIPRGSRRSIRAGKDGAAYLTVHRRRGPLTIGRR
jgi:quercetin dioxygenase-like cupin family protein